MEKTQLHKPQTIDIAIALVGIAMAIVTFIRIPFAFILGFIILMLIATYLLACMGLFDDETETDNGKIR
jgi:hypothetical protein